MKPYISYKEKLLADGGGRGLGNPEFNLAHEKDNGHKKEEEERVLKFNFNVYTPINNMRGIWKEYVNTEFKETGVQIPYLIRESSWT